MVQKISFQKSKETDAFQKLTGKELNAKGIKLGWKEIDDWLANPQTDHKLDFICRIKVVPFELSLNGEKRQVGVIDFFANANSDLYFFLENALKDNNDFELQWIEEHIGKGIGFSENRPNTLVVDSNFLRRGGNKEEREKIRQNSDIRNLEVNWENITVLEWGLSFDLISSPSISNSNYNKVFLPLNYNLENLEWMKKRLTEWKENNKPAIIKNAVLSTKSWLSVKDSNILYVNDSDEIKGLHSEWLSEVVFERQINGWEKFPYREKAKFLKRHKEEDVKDMKNEIEAAIRALENGDNKPDNISPPSPNPNQNNPAKTAPPNQISWKIIIPVVGVVIIVGIGLVWIIRKSRKQKQFKEESGL